MTRTTKRRLGILSGVAAVAMAAVLVTFAVRRQRDARRYAAAVARLDAADPYRRFDDLLASQHATPLPDGENLAVPLAEFLALTVRRDYATLARRADLVRDLAPNVRLTRGQWRAVIDGVEANEAGVALALGLEDYPRGRHAIAYTADLLSTRLEHYEQLGRAAELLDDLHLSAVQRGDAATALRAFRATLNLGRSLRGEPLAGSQVIRANLRKTAIRGLERLLGHAELGDAQLAGVERELRAELADDLWLAAARGDLAFRDRVLGAVRAGLLPPSTLRRWAEVGAPWPRTPAARAEEWLRDRVDRDVTAEHAAALEASARSVAAARRPWPDRWAAVQALPPRDDPDRSELARALIPKYNEIFGRIALDEARVRCALAAVAVERYRLARGDWPATPAALSPQPADPYTGKPLGFRRLAGGVVVYSVGPDGTDDGGELAETTSHVLPSGTDIGFRLWDVPRRNRRPAGGGP